MEDRITDINIVKTGVDDETKYSALIDENKYIEYFTDGINKKHISKAIWMEYAKSIANR